MDKRAARRLVTQRVAAAVRALGDDEFTGYGPEDCRRLRSARDELALELEVRAGVTPRAPRFDPPDPAQYALIHLEDSHAQDHPRTPTG
ncbi:hypothetical protein [Actinophytocola sp.]|uniref:hypothetical protein n=1 Tax=Actinophytocola sp. TaxID=1872138 RepID=UPI002D808410|nr:hypothetical protein [Actinophytocola sp.]HET9144130.1 hypothetical protein [Actinophytocola sp.]